MFLIFASLCGLQSGSQKPKNLRNVDHQVEWLAVLPPIELSDSCSVFMQARGKYWSILSMTVQKCFMIWSCAFTMGQLCVRLDISVNPGQSIFRLDKKDMHFISCFLTGKAVKNPLLEHKTLLHLFIHFSFHLSCVG